MNFKSCIRNTSSFVLQRLVDEIFQFKVILHKRNIFHIIHINLQTTGCIKKNGVLCFNINSKEHKHSLLTDYTSFESPTIQLASND